MPDIIINAAVELDTNDIDNAFANVGKQTKATGNAVLGAQAGSSPHLAALIGSIGVNSLQQIKNTEGIRGLTNNTRFLANTYQYQTRLLVQSLLRMEVNLLRLSTAFGNAGKGKGMGVDIGVQYTGKENFPSSYSLGFGQTQTGTITQVLQDIADRGIDAAKGLAELDKQLEGMRSFNSVSPKDEGMGNILGVLRTGFGALMAGAGTAYAGIKTTESVVSGNGLPIIQGLEESINNIIRIVYGANIAAQEGIILEDRRLQLLKLQYDWLTRQEQIQMALNQAQFDANTRPEKWQRDAEDQTAQNNKQFDDAINDITKAWEGRMSDAMSSLNTAFAQSQTSNYSAWNGTNPEATQDMFGWRRNLDRQVMTFDAQGNAVQKQMTTRRNTTTFGYDGSGEIIYNGKTYTFTNTEEEKEAQRQIREQIEQEIERGQAAQANMTEDQRAQVNRQVKVFAAQQQAQYETDNMYMSSLKDRWVAESNLITSIASARTSADAENYAINMNRIKGEHDAQMKYLAEYTRLRKEAADEGRTDISQEDKEMLDRQRQTRMEMAGATADVQTARSNVYEFSNSSNAARGESEARVTQRMRLQGAQQRFETRNAGIEGNANLNEDQKAAQLRDSIKQLREDLAAAGKEFGNNMLLVTSYGREYESIMKTVNDGISNGAEVMAVQAHLQADLVHNEQAYRRAVQNSTTEEQKKRALMLKQVQDQQDMLKAQNEMRAANARDTLDSQTRQGQRTVGETAISSNAQAASSGIEARSQFRQALTAQMITGRMDPIDIQIAKQKELFDIQMANNKAVHEQRMAQIKVQEDLRRQQIEDDYEQTTKADRQLVADLTAQLADPANANNQQMQANLQAAQARIANAGQTRLTGIQNVERDVRGSVRQQARFDSEQALVKSRHNETISYLNAIKQNTAKVVSDVAGRYKENAGVSWGRFYGNSMQGSERFYNQMVSHYTRQHATWTNILWVGQQVLANVDAITRFSGALPKIQRAIGQGRVGQFGY